MVSRSDALDIRAGVVHYGASGDPEAVKRVVDLTNDLAAVSPWLSVPIRSASHGAYHAVENAALETVEMLREGRSALGPNVPPPMEIVIFFVAAKPGDPNGPPLIARAASILRRAGPTIIVGCPSLVTGACEAPRDMSQRQLFAAPRDVDKLPLLLSGELDRADTAPRVSELSLIQSLPPILEYMPASASEPPVSVEQTITGTHLVWAWSAPTFSRPYTVTFDARPIIEGTGAIEGGLALIDTDGNGRHVPAAGAPVTVSGLCVTPAPTLPSPMPSATNTTPPTATAAPTRAPLPIHLPLVLRESCSAGTQRLDAILLIDTSSSMSEPTTSGRTKLHAAVEAVRVFFDQLHFDLGDQAAIIAFNREAQLLQGLTPDRDALDRALDAIQVAQETCIVCGVSAADEELASPHRDADNVPVMVLLTDGKSNPRPASEAVDRARVAKDRGVIIFTIGLGGDLDVAALGEIASRPGYFYRAPDAEDLAQIYASIAVTIPCPMSAFWGGR